MLARKANRVSAGRATRDPRASVGGTGPLRHVGCGQKSFEGQGSAHVPGGGGGGLVLMEWERRLRARLAARRARECPGSGIGSGGESAPGCPQSPAGPGGARPAGRASASPVLPCFAVSGLPQRPGGSRSCPVENQTPAVRGSGSGEGCEGCTERLARGGARPALAQVRSGRPEPV